MTLYSNGTLWRYVEATGAWSLRDSSQVVSLVSAWNGTVYYLRADGEVFRSSPASDWNQFDVGVTRLLTAADGNPYYLRTGGTFGAVLFDEQVALDTETRSIQLGVDRSVIATKYDCSRWRYLFLVGAPLTIGASQCEGDVNGDGRVDRADAAILAQYFGTSAGAATNQGDLDGDEAVGLIDLVLLQQALTSAESPSPVAPAAIVSGTARRENNALRISRLAQPRTGQLNATDCVFAGDTVQLADRMTATRRKLAREVRFDPT